MANSGGPFSVNIEINLDAKIGNETYHEHYRGNKAPVGFIRGVGKKLTNSVARTAYMNLNKDLDSLVYHMGEYSREYVRSKLGSSSSARKPYLGIATGSLSKAFRQTYAAFKIGKKENIGNIDIHIDPSAIRTDPLGEKSFNTGENVSDYAFAPLRLVKAYPISTLSSALQRAISTVIGSRQGLYALKSMIHDLQQATERLRATNEQRIQQALSWRAAQAASKKAAKATRGGRRKK